MIVEKRGLYEIPFSGADSEAVQVDHYWMAALVMEHVSDVRIPVDNSWRQNEIKLGVLDSQPDKFAGHVVPVVDAKPLAIRYPISRVLEWLQFGQVQAFRRG